MKCETCKSPSNFYMLENFIIIADCARSGERYLDGDCTSAYPSFLWDLNWN